MRRSGFVMILALVFMLVLAAMVMALAYYISSETRGVGFQLDDTKALYLAQAGVERAFREIRDDFLTGPQQGVADLRGATTSTTGSGVSSVANIRYIDGVNATIAGTGTANLRRFDSNYTQTRITSVLIFARASRQTNGNNSATLEVSYSTNNGVTFTPVITQALTTTLTNYSADVTLILTSWPMIVNINNFRLRARRVGTGTSTVNLDALWLRMTYAIDTNTEPWFTGTYDTFPKTLGDGLIQSVSITDEASKVHLNYATQALLRRLMEEYGVASGTANTLATAIVNYRGGAAGPFDSIEELQRVTGMTQTIYNLIKGHVTVYSFINTNSYRPPSAATIASRAPININTAPREVLEAVFDTLVGSGAALDASDVPLLVDDIIDQRSSAPFRCFYSTDAPSTDMTVFYNFIFAPARSSYLSATGNPDERDRILDTADASSLVPVSGSTAFTSPATEFCYANTTYKIESVGKITVPGDITNDINLRVKTIVGNDGSRTFQNYTGDTTLTGYWKENYE